jgi:hypothetical protein
MVILQSSLEVIDTVELGYKSLYVNSCARYYASTQEQTLDIRSPDIRTFFPILLQTLISGFDYIYTNEILS